MSRTGAGVLVKTNALEQSSIEDLPLGRDEQGCFFFFFHDNLLAKDQLISVIVTVCKIQCRRTRRYLVSEHGAHVLDGSSNLSVIMSPDFGPSG